MDKYSLVELEFEFVIFAVLEETSGDLLGDDLGADVILRGETQAHLLQDQLNLRYVSVLKPLLGIQIRIRNRRIHIFLGLPDSDPLVRDTDPDPSIIKQN